jgi:diguanylate cyclase (GGDEF)-like protein
VGLVLPGTIAHVATEVADAADRLATGTLADLTRAMQRLAAGDLAAARARVDIRHVIVHSGDELGQLAHSFNIMQDEVARTATALGGAREELRDSRRHLEQLAATDPLTGISNRRHFETELESHVASVMMAGEHRGQSALLILDLDNFKYINDSHGHASGDKVLQQVSVILVGTLRSTDVVARLGGDEFAILLRDVQPDDASRIASQIRQNVRSMRFLLDDGQHLRLSVSIGITTFDSGDRTNPGELMINADIAMYDAKEGGRDRVSIASTDVHQSRAKSRQTWLEEIRDALEDDRMELHAQPILHIATNTITQHELLIRMRNRNGDLIPPMTFLEVAERSGLIREIDRWVVRAATTLILEAADVGRATLLQINVSGVSVSDPDFLEAIEPDLRRLGERGSSLIFEVTETAAVTNLAQANAFAQRLAPFGCGLALDDFGAGFSSFYSLKQLPYTYLKIDGEFVRTLPTSKVDQVFVKANVALAQGLGKQTIAEFVEDEATLQLLASLGIDYAQGFYIGRPTPVSELWASARQGSTLA